MTSIGILGAHGRMGRAIANAAAGAGASVAGGIDLDGGVHGGRRGPCGSGSSERRAGRFHRARSARRPSRRGGRCRHADRDRHDRSHAPAITRRSTPRRQRSRSCRPPTPRSASTCCAPWSSRRRAGSGRTGTSRSSRCTTGTSWTAPSGTALLLGASASQGRGAGSNVELNRFDRMQEGPHEREEGGIYYASLRGGSVAGDHLVIFAGEGERIELGHRAESRAIFAKGAVEAALWLHGQPPGRYTMQDVLGLGERAGPGAPARAAPPARPVRRDHAGHGRDHRLRDLRQSGRWSRRACTAGADRRRLADRRRDRDRRRLRLCRAGGAAARSRRPICLSARRLGADAGLPLRLVAAAGHPVGRAWRRWRSPSPAISTS